MDFHNRLSSEMVRALRGSRSQNWLSGRMGLTFNVVTRWESGSRTIRLSEFAKLCKCLKVDLPASLGLMTGRKATGPVVALKRLCAQLSVSEGAEVLGCSTSSFYRLAKGEVDPKMPQFLRLIEHSGNLERWMRSLGLEPAELPSLQAELERASLARQFFAKFPMASPILLYLDTQTYQRQAKHSDEMIAKRFQLELSRVKAIVADLKDLGLVRVEKRKLVPESGFINVGWGRGSDLKSLHKIEKFWVQLAASSYREDSLTEREVVGFQVFHSSPETIAAIRDCLSDFYKNVHRVLEDADGPKTEELAVLNYQLLKI